MSTETQQAAAPATPAKATPEAAPVAAPEAADAPASAVDAAAPEASAGAETAQVSEDGVATAEAGVAALSITQPLSELHRACAEGRLEEVRGILAHGLENLETLGECV